MIVIENNLVFSDRGMTVRRKGTEITAPARRLTALPGDSADMFEEAAEVPEYTTAEYNATVERLISERYTTGQEIQFAREKEAAGAKYAAYLEYVEECKARARRELGKMHDA